MKISLSLLILTFILSACATSGVLTKKTEGVDYSQYKTYQIFPYVNEEDAINKKVKINKVNKKRIEDALMEALTLRGMDTAKQSDVTLLYAVDIDMEKSYSRQNNYHAGGYHGGGAYYGGGGYYGGGAYYSYNNGHYGGYGYSYGVPYSTVEEHNYEMGRLRLGMIDTKTGELVWLGSTSEKLKNKPNKAERQIKKVVRKIMMDFPISNH